jgi:hypothetical protein
MKYKAVCGTFQIIQTQCEFIPGLNLEKASLEWCRGNSKIWENPVRENTTHYTVGYTCKVVLSSYLALGCERTLLCYFTSLRLAVFIHMDCLSMYLCVCDIKGIEGI